MNFGVPSKKQRREEKYPNTAVMTLAEDGGKGKAKHLILNGKACEELNLPEKKATIAFSFDDGKITIMNGNQVGIPEQYRINVTKNSPRRISDKKTYEFISSLLDLDNTVENELFLVRNADSDNGIVTFNATENNRTSTTTSDTSTFDANDGDVETVVFDTSDDVIHDSSSSSFGNGSFS